MNKRLWIVALLFLPSLPLFANEQGVIVRESTVYSDASSSSRKIGKISAGSRVNIFSRKGGWKEIFAEQQELIGWVRSFQVREGDYAPEVESGTEADSRGFLSGLAAFSRKASRFFSPDNSSSSSGTATIGVRGLSEAEIREASPDPVQLRKMQDYASNSQRMAQFGLEGQLSINEVAHLKSKKKKKKKKKEPNR